jgi:hypothetical protein
MGPEVPVMPGPITGAPAAGAAAELPPFALIYDPAESTVSLSPFKTLEAAGGGSAPKAASALSDRTAPANQQAGSRGAPYGGGRALGGYDRAGVVALDGGALNYFQWVFMDVALDGAIHAFDEVSNKSTGALNLTAPVETGHTYHVLLLAGYNPDPGVVDPTLLASAYTQFTATGSGGALNLTLIPVVVDMKFSGGPDGDRQIGRLAKTVGLDSGQTYTLEYFIGSKDNGVKALSDPLRQAANDGLWPLKLADVAVRRDDTWRYKYSELKNGVRETKTGYQAGVLDTVEVLLNNARGTNLAWVEWADRRIDAMNDLSVNQSKQTTGRGRYGFTARQETLATDPVTQAVTPMTGRVWFHLEYVPFAVFDDAAWKAASTASSLTERPVWVIRNGLTDAGQDASSWSGAAYDGKGAISLGVVAAGGVAAQGMGLYEENNPWPVAVADMDQAANLANALDALNVPASGYGAYTLQLGAQPDVPAYITLGGTSLSDAYPDIRNARLAIEGTTPIELPSVADLWELGSGDTVSYGANVKVVTWTTFVYNTGTNPANNVTVRLRRDAGWAGAAPNDRLAILSTTGAANSALTFNGVPYTKQNIRSITWGNDVEGATVLGNNFLMYCTGLTKLDLSPLTRITGIGNACLYQCTGLKELDLSHLVGITSIGSLFLDGCTGLKELDLSHPVGITSIGYYFLHGCTGLTKLDLPTLAAGATVDTYFLYNCTSLKELDLSPLAQITSISNSFMKSCTILKKLDLSPLTRITSIKNDFLYDCTGLEELALPPLSGISIGEEFLYNCTSLKELDLSMLSGLTSIGKYFMEQCTGLTKLDLPTVAANATVGLSFLVFCTSLTQLDLSPLALVTSIGAGFLQGCVGLTQLDLSPLTVITGIDGHFLRGCSNLATVNMGSIASDKIATTYSFNTITSCAVKVIGSVPAWNSKFPVNNSSGRSAGVSFTN